MHGLSPTDSGKILDWNKVSEEYALYRPGPPISFYQTLLALGIGLPKQKILDLGTGTGVLARQFAKQGAIVSGVDITEGQIAVAKRLALGEKLSIDFHTCPAEETPFENNSFDIITASQCWIYFDHDRIISEIRRLLEPNGILLTTHICWLTRIEKIVKAAEELILKYNPTWSVGDYSGDVPLVPDWSKQDFRVSAMFYYDESISFTRESWRGRIRSSRGIGGELTQEEVLAFDKEHRALLEKIAPESFSILHRIDCHIFQLHNYDNLIS